MEKKYIKEVHSLSDLVKTVTKIKAEVDGDLWFRGSDCNTHKLIPGVYRTDFDRVDEEGLINAFYLKAPTLLKRDMKDGWEWLALMQHYGLPTRLLDWSQSYLVAMFFALNSYDPLKGHKKPCIWIIDPTELNKQYTDEGDVFLAENPRLYQWLPETLRFPNPEGSGAHWRDLAAKAPGLGQFPVSIFSKAVDERLVVQRGAFTLHGNYSGSLEDYAGTLGAKRMFRIDFDLDRKIRTAKSLLDELLLAGTSHASLFPDVQGLATHLKWYYRKNP